MRKIIFALALFASTVPAIADDESALLQNALKILEMQRNSQANQAVNSEAMMLLAKDQLAGAQRTIAERDKTIADQAKQIEDLQSKLKTAEAPKPSGS